MYTGVMGKFSQGDSPNSSSSLYHRLENPIYGAVEQGTPEYATPSAMQHMAQNNSGSSDPYYSIPDQQHKNSTSKESSSSQQQLLQYDYVSTSRWERVPEASDSSMENSSASFGDLNGQTQNEFENTYYERIL